MSELPDEDQAPLLPPSTVIGIWKGAAADGREVVALPWSNPRLSGTLDVIGLAGQGWYLRVTDACGTVVWSILLEGLDELPDVSPG